MRHTEISNRGPDSLGSPILSILIGFALAGHITTAQGDPLILQTGSNQPIQTLSVSLAVPSGSPQSVLQFDFGFSTDETVVSGIFLDSFSATLQSDDALTTALIVTADTSGVNWAPGNPGGVVIDLDGILQTPIASPTFAQGFANVAACSTTFPVPADFAGKPATLYLAFSTTSTRQIHSAGPLVLPSFRNHRSLFLACWA